MNISFRNIGLILKREYLTRVKKWSFIITTILAPLGMSAILLISIWSSSRSMSEQKIAVVDDTHAMQGKLKDTETIYFKYSNEPLDSLKKNYKKLDFTGILHIPSNYKQQSRAIEYFSEEQLGLKLKYHIQNEIDDVIEKENMKESGISEEQLEKLKSNISINDQILKEGGVKKGNSLIATGVGYFIGMLLYFVLIFYGVMVMRGVAEEKTNRIVEVIISTVKPIELMFGKIFGLVLLGLTQFALWIVLGGIAYIVIMIFFGADLQAAQMASMSPDMTSNLNSNMSEIQEVIEGLSSLPWLKIVISFFFFFFGGYMLYASMFAAVGAMTNEETESQSMTFPIMLPIIISMTMLSGVIAEPNSSLAIWMSMIPFTSPIIMMARVIFDVPIWQILLSFTFLMLGVIFCAWLASKIYRIAILMYGKKITVKEMLKWMKY